MELCEIRDPLFVPLPFQRTKRHMDSDQENKVDEDSVRSLSDRLFLGFCHHHDFLSDPYAGEKFHLTSPVDISFFLVPTLEEYLR
jgi:hypothetical protein